MHTLHLAENNETCAGLAACLQFEPGLLEISCTHTGPYFWFHSPSSFSVFKFNQGTVKSLENLINFVTLLI